MATIAQTFRKDPDAILDYGFDWSSWLATSETIASSSWTVPTGITNVNDTNDETSTKIWLSGGTVATTYTLTNQITTSGGRTEDRTFEIVVEER